MTNIENVSVSAAPANHHHRSSASVPVSVSDAFSASVFAHPSSERWKAPCAGKERVLGSPGRDDEPGDDDDDEGNEDDDDEEEGDDDDDGVAVSVAHLKHSFKSISARCQHLRAKVVKLKQRYAKRFSGLSDEDIASDLEKLQFQLDGMPNLNKKTGVIRLRKMEKQVVQIVKQTLDDMSRVAIFLEKLERDERTHEPGRTFVNEIEVITDHHEHGFYWIMCQLNRILIQTGSAGHRPGRDIRKIRPVEAQTRAIRHWRDYLIIRDLERLLSGITDQMNSVHRTLARIR